MRSAEPTTADAVPLTPRVEAILAQQGSGRSLLADRHIRQVVWEDRRGIELTLRLTSYRALPLSCIASIALRIDGVAVDLAGAVLVVAGAPYALHALGGLADIWWFILDEALLFVPISAPSAGTCRVECTLETVEPYVTAGRLSFFNSAERVLTIAGAAS